MAIGELVVRIVGDASDLTRELQQAANSSDTFAVKARASLNAVGLSLGAVGAAAAAALGVMVNAGIASATEIKNLSSVANASAAEFQAMAYAARSVGIEQDKLADILKDVNDRIGDFITTGGGPMADFFERIAPRVGVTVEQFRKLNGPDALALYVSSLEKANLSQQEMTFFMEAMASDSTRLIPLLQGNAEGLRAMADEARRLGVVTSNIDIAKIEAAKNSMSNAAAVSEAFNRQLATEAAPVIEGIAEGFKAWAMEMGGFDKVARKTIDGIAMGAGFVADVFRGWQIIIQGSIALLRTLLAEATRGIDYLAKGSEGWRRDFWEGVDGLGEKLGIELDMSGAAEKAAANIESFSEAAVKAAEDSINELKAIASEPLPSDQLNARLEEWRANAEVAAAEIVKAREATQTKSNDATPETKGGQRFTTTESDAGIEQIRARLAERSATFDAWRKSQADKEGNYSRSQLDLFKEYEDTRAAEMKAAHEREDALIADRLAKGLIDKKAAGEMQLQLDRDQQAQVIEARLQAAAELAELTGQPAPIDPLGAEGADAVLVMRERLQEQADTMAEYNALKLEMLDAQQVQELAILQARRDAELLSAEEFEALKTGIEEEGTRKRKELAEAERSAKLGIAGGMFDNLSSLMQSGSKKMFNIGKVASLASGAISAYESVMSAYAKGAKVGGPWTGAAYAASAALAQAGNLRKLSSVSFGGGSGGISASSGGNPSAGAEGGGGTTAAPAAPVMPSRNISISLAGSTFSADTVRELITQINEQIGDGATITAG